MRQIAKKTFTADLVREGSWGTSELGNHASTMTLYACDEPGRALIDWDVPSLDTGEQIGLSFDVDRNLLDYDGVFSLPREAVALLRANGFHVARSFE